jgi:Mg2+ and Co2+ transporter CorA
MWECLRRDPLQSTLNMNIGATPVTLRLPIMLEHWKDSTSCMKSLVSRLLRSHTAQSVLNSKAVPCYGPHDGPADAAIFALLLVESIWQHMVASLEGTLPRYRHDAARLPDDEAFPRLRKFRRQVADAQMLIAETKERCTQVVGYVNSWCVDGQSLSADKFWSQKSSATVAPFPGYARSMDIKNFFDAMERLEGKIDALSQAINEEIQIVIGSVQVEDAQTMKRQTEWTVVLAVLAAIYLPMTLVTGIFGMNIKEINTDDTRPDKWWTIKVWLITFGATVGCVLLYAIARRLIRPTLDERENLLKIMPRGPELMNHVFFHVDKSYGKILPAKVWQWMVRRILKRLEVSSKRFQDLEAQKLE